MIPGCALASVSAAASALTTKKSMTCACLTASPPPPSARCSSTGRICSAMCIPDAIMTTPTSGFKTSHALSRLQWRPARVSNKEVAEQQRQQPCHCCCALSSNQISCVSRKSGEGAADTKSSTIAKREVRNPSEMACTTSGFQANSILLASTSAVTLAGAHTGRLPLHRQKLSRLGLRQAREVPSG